MVLAGFDPKGCRSVRVIAYQLTGPSAMSVVSECTLEVEYEDHQEEVTVPFLDNPMALPTLQALIEALNRALGG